MKLRNLFKAAVSAAVGISVLSACAVPCFARSIRIFDWDYYHEGGIKSGDFIYEIDEDGAAVLTKYCGKAKKVTVPEFIDGYRVETLQNTFQGNERIREVTLPDNISVDCEAFEFAESLTTVNNLENAYSIGDEAFYCCYSLDEIKLGDNLHSLDSNSFHGSGWYQSMPNGEVYFGNIFMGIKGMDTKDIKKLNIQEGTTLVPRFHYDEYPDIVEVNLPSSVKYISDRAFENKNISKLTFGDKLRYIGEYSFAYTNITSMIMPDTVEEVGRSAFCGCNKLSEVKLSKKIEVIHKNTFGGTAIKAFDFPKSIKRISNGKSKLSSYVLESNVKKICEYAFYGCNKLESITIPDSVTAIEYRSFYDCAALKSVNLPNNIKKIDCSTFSNCTSLKSITIPDSVTKINCGAFEGCTSLENIHLPKNLKKLGEKDPDKTRTENKPLKYSYCRHGSGVFSDCKSLEKIELPDGLEFIGNRTFAGCPKLTKIDIPDSVKAIDTYAFCSCLRLESITIPDKVTVIDEGAFTECKRLKTVVLSKNVKKICDSAFEDCLALENLKLPDGCIYFGKYVMKNTAWYNSHKDGFVYLGKYLCGYKGDMPQNTKLKVKKGTVGIAGCAFEKENNLVSLTCSGSEKYIGKYAFYGCSKLRSVKLKNGLQAIEAYTFYDCDSLKTIKLPDTIKTIGSCAFEYCDKLTVANLPKKIADIGREAFSHCKLPDSLTFSKNVKEIGSWAFGNTNLKSVVFKNPETAIHYNAFADCKALKSVKYPSGIYKIEAEAFDGTPWYKKLLKKHKNQIVYIGKCAYAVTGDVKSPVTLKKGTKGICLDERAFDEILVPDTVKFIWYRALYWVLDEGEGIVSGVIICSENSLAAEHALNNGIVVRYTE